MRVVLVIILLLFLTSLSATDLLNNIYFDIGVGFGFTSGHEVKIMRRHRRHHKFEDNTFNGGTAMEFGVRVGRAYDDLPMFIVVEFIHSMGNVATAESDIPINLWNQRISDFSYTQSFVGPGVVAYMAPNFQLSAAAGFTFGSIEYNYLYRGEETTITDRINPSFALSLSMAFDFELFGQKLQAGVGTFSTDFNQQGNIKHNASFTGRLFVRYALYNNDRIRRYYNRP